MTKSNQSSISNKLAPLRIGIVVPHIFMQDSLLPKVIFSPGQLAIDLAEGLVAIGQKVTLFSPGPVKTVANNLNADLSYFEKELEGRGDSYIDLLKKHPLTFISLSRQVQAELIANAFSMANDNLLDIVHIYTNEEDIALPFTKLCNKPVVFTHHDPFNFLINYKNIFPKYKNLNWISISLSQRKGMPVDSNWVGNIYHGLSEQKWDAGTGGDYLTYIGRIIEPKGLHLAIGAVKKYNASNENKITLKIAGKHYAGHKKDSYWQEVIQPQIDNRYIKFVGHLNETQKAKLLRGSKALIVPSIFDEPFGMVAIEALASATPVICLDSGALPEIIKDGATGIIVSKSYKDSSIDSVQVIDELASAIGRVGTLDRHLCRKDYEKRFTLKRMCTEYNDIYKILLKDLL